MRPRAPSLGFAQLFNYAGILAIHVFTVWGLTHAFTWRHVALAAAAYVVRMFAVTGVYHRYFSHRGYKTSRALQLFFALLGTAATQKGPLWWASMHRHHHKFSDQPEDAHSPRQRGLWEAHMGWWMRREHEATRWEFIPDFAKYPELRWVDRYHWVGLAVFMAATVWAGAALGIGKFDGYIWGYVISTCALLHGTFTINSLAHVFGSRRYATKDTSRNNLLLALLTMGEGWHNNHHHYAASARQGFYWWEIDLTYYVLKALSWVGLVWDLRQPPPRVLEEGRRARGADAPQPAE
ncbi:MAG: acyl-CoA desaturase [Polyangiaceae bacterium]|nr:acyl-CoA desaturase [Polyangiaceae bacterium]